MIINNTDNNVFTSRNRTIRYADDIARKVNKLYPALSTSRVTCYDDYALHPNLQDKISMLKIQFVRKMRDKLYDNAINFTKKIEAFINPVRLYKTANCGEKTHLASIMAKMNGIKNCRLAFLYNANGRDLDHTVLFVDDKKPYIIDAWLGFADYVPNALQRYQQEYKQFFDIREGYSIGFATKFDDEFTHFFKKDFTKKQRKEIRKVFPELVLNDK